MARTPTWKGSRQLEEQPDSPHLEHSADDVTLLRRFEGPYTLCRSSRPKPGTQFYFDGFSFTVKKASVRKLPGDRGELLVTYKAGEGEEERQPIIEIEWLRIEKPLASAEIFDPMTDADWSAIAEWRACEQAHPDRYGRFQHQTDGDGDWKTLSGLALKFAQKVRRGQDSYWVWTPVVRNTKFSSTRPVTGSCGKIGAPSGGGPAGYVYLKTADRATRQQGEWTRVQEWTGADSWDTDLYS